ncbi:arsenate reductase [Shewanella sp. NFH-SH190041]|uniref:arsenate reductase (glutaredoxin) n=1 Tax=Shewanella sp. NFH-SH190041 TaxID=2950245 RepID=UPI0021C3A42E|nr:arsenate reductase (glutaredoxin) [Shewanella sp. NFH-SH190041]BDM64798.1 arsenate reductase [Shewanella sp. NFH-SH190041]
MSPITLLHNPRCSKSRAALALLQQRNQDVTVVQYLKTPLSLAQLEVLMSQLGLQDPREMMRTKEAEYQQLQLDNAQPAELLRAIATTPKLLERPIAIVGNRAVIGRPPETVLELI